MVDCFIVVDIEAIAVDEVNGFLYWSEGKSRGSTIKRATLDGGNTTDIVGAGKLYVT